MILRLLDKLAGRWLDWRTTRVIRHYVTFDMPRFDREIRPIRVTVQWERGKSLGKIVTELKARIVELEDQLRR